MESKVKTVSPEALVTPLLELLEETDHVPLIISGDSMTPFLAPGRDAVYLSKARFPLKRGDMIFYRRDSGNYVLHRIYRVEADSYTLLGDAQTLPEPGIRRDQILAQVTAVRRKGKILQKGSFWWDFFEKVWIRTVSLRPAVRAAYACLRRLFG